MSGLVGLAAYGSSSEDEEDKEEVEETEEKAAVKEDDDSDEEEGEDSDDDDDDDEEREGGKKEKSSAGTSTSKSKSGLGLPSALDLLETTEAPSFLQHPKREPEVTPIFRAPPSGPKPGHGRNFNKRPAPSQGGPPPSRPPPQRQPPPPAKGAVAGGDEATGKRAKMGDKKDVKERVKEQRMKGQSGIGDDFRVWRSEEEMRMRQGFD